jgi:hypothetical protein
VVNVTGLGLLLPSEMVQSALDAFTTHLTENYPLDPCRQRADHL